VTWDSRVWRTLFPLLFRPGFLSAEFNAGRRMRYMPPFRLYIVVSFLMFLVLSISAENSISVDDGYIVAGDGGERVADPDSLPEDARARIDEANKKIADLEAQGKLARDDDVLNFDLAGDDAPAWAKDFEQRLELNATKVKDDPQAYMESLVEYLPQMMFVMLPLFALLLKLFYLFSPFHYLQHLVFALHYHTFVYLIFIFDEGLEQLGAPIDGLFGFALLIYLPLALSKTYGSGRFAAIGKALLLLVSYSLALVLGTAVAAIAVLAAM
jgi:hypothetical protein